MKIKIDVFEGKRPRIAERLLGERQASVAVDCDLLTGDLRAIKEPKDIETVPSGTETIYLNNEFSAWLHWSTDVDVARGTVSADQYKRIYTTGDGVPKVIGNGTEEYDLGMPAPASAPSITVEDKTSIDEWSPRWNYFYEELDGSQADAGKLSGVGASKAGVTYKVALPQRADATPNAKFVMWMEARDENENVLGVVYPSGSLFSNRNTFFQDGAKASADLNIEGGEATFSLKYDTSGSEAVVARAYAYTFVSIFGEEGAPSEPSVVTNVNPSQTAIIGDLDVSVSGNRKIASKRLYRVNPGNTGEAYQFVAELDAGDQGFRDTVLDADLGEIMVTTDYFPPPEDLKGLAAHPNGFMVGFDGRDIYFSEPDQPHAWPTAYVQSVDWDIVALGIAGNSVVVMTNGFPYYATGTHPEQVVLTRVPSNQPCVSKKSVADIGYAVLYASNDGLVMVRDGVANLVTRTSHLRDEWKLLSPEDMIGEVHDQIYYGFSADNAIAIDFDEGRSAITSFSATPEALFADLEEDVLYFVDDDTIKQWRGGDDNETLTWRSGQFTSGRDSTMGVGRVVASSYPATLKIYRDGSEVADISVADNSAFRLPALERGRYWQAEVTVNADVQEILLSTSMRDL
jgi:hypothetical protein